MAKNDYNILELMKSIDVLVDGKYIEEKKNLSLHYRGSSNQRILDMQESLRRGKAIEVERYKSESQTGEKHYGKAMYMFI